MNDNNKTPIHLLVKEQNVPSSIESDKLASDITERQEKQIIINIASTGKWKYVAISNYAIMYSLMFGVIVGDMTSWWHVQIDQTILATFIGATIGSTIPFYLQFHIGKRLNQNT